MCTRVQAGKDGVRVPLLSAMHGLKTSSPTAVVDVEEDVYDEPPEDAANCCSRALFCWNVRLMRKGVLSGLRCGLCQWRFGHVECWGGGAVGLGKIPDSHLYHLVQED
jgi:hypothetical protein